MADIALVYDSVVTNAFDWAITDDQLQLGNDLYTAIALSLFTDARAHQGDVIPDGSGNPRGSPIDIGGNYQFGSRLWLLKRQPTTNANLLRAKDFCNEALAWMIGDGVAGSIDVDVEFLNGNMLGIGITITMPDSTIITFNYQWAWG